jgi:hypothetical protein
MLAPLSESSTAYLCARIAPLWILVLGGLLLRAWQTKAWFKTPASNLLFLFIVLLYSYLVCLHAPGFVTYDDISLMVGLFRDGSDGYFIPWVSFSYAVLIGSLITWFRSNLGITVFNVFMFLLLLHATFKQIEDAHPTRRRLGISVLVLLALHPLHQGLLLLQNRDVTFSLILCWLGLYSGKKRHWSNWSVVMATTLLSILSEMRPEFRIGLAVFPLVLLGLRLWHARELKIFVAVACFWGILLFGVTPKVFRYEIVSQKYKIILYAQPLAQIFHDLKPADIPTELTEKIDTVVNVEMLRTEFSADDVLPIHRGAIRREASPEQWQEFQNAARELILNHLDLYLVNRKNMIWSLLNPGVHSYVFDDKFRNDVPNFAEVRGKLGLDPLPPRSNVAERHYQWLESFTNQGKVLGLTWLRTYSLPIVLSFLILLYSLARFRTRPDMAFAAALILSRIPIVFLLTPASYFKYLYSVLILATLQLPVWIATSKPPHTLSTGNKSNSLPV